MTIEMERLPGQFAIYKKNGAAQFNLLLPHYKEFTRKDGTKAERIEREGSVLLEVAAGKGDKVYDWANKVSLSIGLSDLAIWMKDTDNVSLFHDTPNSPEMKKLTIVPGRDSGYMLTLTETTTKRTVTVPLHEGEYQLLLRLLVSAAPTFIGWM